MTQATYKILIVQNCSADRDFIRHCLQNSDRVLYQVVEATTGTEGLQQFRIIQPDAILLDYRLVDKTESSFLQRDELFNIPVVVLTESNEALPAQEIQQDVQVYLNKSTLTAESLQLALQSVINQGKLLHQVAELKTQTHLMLEALGQQVGHW
jgi:CheY-like chemotaxis protein